MSEPKQVLSEEQYRALRVLRAHSPSSLSGFRVSTIRALLRRGLIASRSKSPVFAGNRYHLTKTAAKYAR